jgi:hypothetical protein
MMLVQRWAKNSKDPESTVYAFAALIAPTELWVRQSIFRSVDAPTLIDRNPVTSRHASAQWSVWVV